LLILLPQIRYSFDFDAHDVADFGQGQIPLVYSVIATRHADMESPMFLENRFAKVIGRVAANSALPLRVELWNGRHFDLSSEPTVKVVIPKPSALRYFMPPNLIKLGEAFVEGHIHVEGPIHELFKVAEGLARSSAASLRAGLGRFQHHSPSQDRKAIEYHYDVSNDFYSLFLDRNMVYSCAYYRHETDSLDTAQEQKLDHILNKLMLKPGERFLDIGCGWGALIVRAAQKYGATATGITLSKNQYAYARERIRAEGLQDRCTVELRDYRELPDTGEFDKIASVGMFEHVGLKNLSTYFRKICLLLKHDGLVLNHGITATDDHEGDIGAQEFIDRYVFPDSELPHVALTLKEMSGAGLEVTDVESLRRHYARTCHEWTNRLEANRDRALRIAGERRLRIWAIYLAGCAYGFANGWMNVYQILGCKTENTAAKPLPLTRAYMYGA
jgi:cyclopropane-fatty-acyl-phospholipid synthase